MKIVFCSNFLNHHQIPFSNNMYKILKDNYTFIQTQEMDEERKNMGWGIIEEEYPYLYKSFVDEKTKNKALELINNADVVIHGSAPWSYIKDRLKHDRLTFFYSERFFKKGFIRAFYPPTTFKLLKYKYKPSKNKNTYMLCASGYTSYDLSRVFSYKNKTYKWGYYTEFIKYNMDDLFKFKDNSITKILWAGRLIDWKHTNDAIEVAKKLKSNGYKFILNIIGNGILENKLKKMVEEYGLDKEIEFLGSMSPKKVREYMEQSNIYLFTSDFQEGWGAVLNEAMNSGCAIVASHSIGSVPFLIRHKENGMIYKYGDIDDLYKNVEKIIDNIGLQKELGLNAYKTIEKSWNANEASKRILELSKALLYNKNIEFEDGPCSRAQIIKNDWWREY